MSLQGHATVLLRFSREACRHRSEISILFCWHLPRYCRHLSLWLFLFFPGSAMWRWRARDAPVRGGTHRAIAAANLCGCFCFFPASARSRWHAGVAPVRGGTYFSLQRQRKVGKRKPLTPLTPVRTSKHQRPPHTKKYSASGCAYQRAMASIGGVSPLSLLRKV